MRKVFYFLLAAVTLVLAACKDKNAPEPTVNYPEGAIHGLFSVGANKQIMFSQGNLQYHQDKAAAHNDYFAFAEHQYDVIGKEGNEGIGSVPCTIDLFGWGTGNMPRQTSTSNADYAEFHDWGANKIKNGGNEAGLWRTPSKDEWVYLFFKRNNAARLFSMGSVNGVNGIILLPDNWKGEMFDNVTDGLVAQEESYENSTQNNYDLHTYTAEQWAAMEADGAVFLPATGYRYQGTKVDQSDVTWRCRYWACTQDESGYKDFLHTAKTGLYLSSSPDYNKGFAVRLIREK